jgi:hypothetical protein
VADRTGHWSLFAHDAHSFPVAPQATQRLRTASAGGRARSARLGIGVRRPYPEPSRRKPPLLLYPRTRVNAFSLAPKRVSHEPSAPNNQIHRRAIDARRIRWAPLRSVWGNRSFGAATAF